MLLETVGTSSNYGPTKNTTLHVTVYVIFNKDNWQQRFWQILAVDWSGIAELSRRSRDISAAYLIEKNTYIYCQCTLGDVTRAAAIMWLSYVHLQTEEKPLALKSVDST